VESALAGNAEAARETTIAMHESERFEVGVTLAPNSIGAPVVDPNGDVVGGIISAGEKSTVRPSNNGGSLLVKTTSEGKPRWPATAEAFTTPTPLPRPTPKPRLVYAPPPAFPSEVRSRPGVSWSGRFRLSFNARGNVTNIRITQSTGNN